MNSKSKTVQQITGEIRQDACAPRLAHYLHFLYFSALMRWVDDDALSLADEFADVLEFFNEGAMGTR